MAAALCGHFAVGARRENAGAFEGAFAISECATDQSAAQGSVLADVEGAAVCVLELRIVNREKKEEPFRG